MTTVISPPDQGVVLEGISWDTYERLLAEHQDSAGTRFTYDRGKLEIMVLSAKHEKYKDILALMVNLLAEAMGFDVSSFGSTTFRRKDSGRGFEPDACFYIQSAELVSYKEELDITVDPPPDLVIEIDISRSSLNKMPVFAAVGVPEVWRYDGKQVTILALAGNSYVESKYSLALPGLTSQSLTVLADESKAMKRTDWMRRVRELAHQQSSKDK
jgi:Uma2 family endonuclease